MGKKIKIIKKILNKELEKLYEMRHKEEKTINDARKNLPDDPSLGFELDGFVNENPYLKRDQLESSQHVIGYCTGAICKIENFLELIDMGYDDIIEMLENNKKIKKQNKKYMDNLFKKIKKNK